MSIQSVNASVSMTSVKYEASIKTAEAKTQGEESKVAKTDSFVRSEQRQEVGYGNVKGLSAEEIDAINDQRITSLKNMVEKLISGQADKAGNISFKSSEFNLSISMSKVEQVQGSIYDDPTFGVDAMATKLMDMAISLSGGDSSKAETLLGAVRKGFEMAEKAWGDKLPGVCQATMDEVEKRFDYWKQNGNMNGYVFEGYTVRD